MSNEPLVLAVDDDIQIQRLVKLTLEEQGLLVRTCGTGKEAIAAVAESRPDIVLLDLRLPDIPGLEVLAEIRARSTTPVILLTASGGTSDRVKGLDFGADDYVVKPFSPEELGARVRAVLRRETRGTSEAGTSVNAGPFVIDLERRMVTKNGETIPLTRTEWSLLQFLAENRGKVMLRPQILSHVWGPEYLNDIQYLRVWISRIRRKLSPNLIQTFPGIGYRFVDEMPREGEPEGGATP